MHVQCWTYKYIQTPVQHLLIEITKHNIKCILYCLSLSAPEQIINCLLFYSNERRVHSVLVKTKLKCHIVGMLILIFAVSGL